MALTVDEGAFFDPSNLEAPAGQLGARPLTGDGGQRGDTGDRGSAELPYPANPALYVAMEGAVYRKRVAEQTATGSLIANGEATES